MATARGLGLTLLVMASLPPPALAQQTHSSPDMTCEELKKIVADDGAVLLHTSATKFDRYVRDRSLCAASDVAKAAWIASSDHSLCHVGYTCKSRAADSDR
jgi:hypothetical protein